ncbi:hypothetical protein JZ751_008030 [Albula glossodonta]|uniref:Uncharacterized protein n=1 Tax=Albula glossodonta TaxID=121402 RepID=A0A8T2P396_9TELE|nr:hypothetical protein JZ751_008030 [Albula glossodonta]
MWCEWAEGRLFITSHMSRAHEGHEGQRTRVRTSQRSTLSSVLQYLESRPVPHTTQASRTPGLQHNGQSSATSSLRSSNTILRKRRPNCVDAPDDSFFLVSRETRKVRRLLSRSQLRRACRQPCEQIGLRRALQVPPHGPVLTPLHPSLRARGPIVIHD